MKRSVQVQLGRWAGGLGSVLLVALATPVQALTTHTVAVVSLEDDPRYQLKRLEKAYPGHPWGRLLHAVRLGISATEVALAAAGQKLLVREVSARNAADLSQVLEQLKTQKVAYWVLDLPEAQTSQAVQAAGMTALLFNASSAGNSLRAQDCSGALFHTYPSQHMLQDALAQYLAAHSWRNALVLQGSSSQDQALGQSWQRAAGRYGVKTTGIKTFKLSGDPRERDLANPRLLTGDRKHDVVAVMDADGEFARTLPYATQWPRPVVGANGLTPLAWHPHWERNGGPQVNRRFMRLAARPMTGQDWAAWVAVKTVAALVSDYAKAPLKEQARLLRSGQVGVDGAKGVRLTFRPWDGQLRQPVFLGHVDGVVGLAPVDGVLHPTEVLDTLGVDDKESVCQVQP